MLSKDKELNIKRSFFKFLYERVSASYFINYSEARGETLEDRSKNKVDGYWKWIDIPLFRVGPGIFCVAMLQINCHTIIANDRYGVALDEMADEVQGQLNVDTIPLLDFSEDPEDPIATDNVLIPRFRDARSMPNVAGDTVNVKQQDWNLYIWRESVLP